MDTWFNAVAVCGAVAFVLALLYAAFLPRVTQQFSLRSLGLGDDARVSDIIKAIEARPKRKPSVEAFRGNLNDPGFWYIVAGLWLLFGSLCLFMGLPEVVWAIVADFRVLAACR